VAHRFDGAELQRRREERGMARTPFAVGIGRSAQALAAYEYGNRIPPVPVVEKMAALLGCQPGDLFVDDGQPDPGDEWVRAALLARIEQGFGAGVEDDATLHAIAEILLHADPARK
jgi:DNA-binding XRE family transcriptional regulator